MSNPNYAKVATMPRIVTVASDRPNWWTKLKEPLRENLICKQVPCSWAPEGHRKHPPHERNISLAESRLIIQYLVHFDVISYGKGLVVWENMISRGYLTHRTPQSLNNFFKKTLLRDIKDYKLPADVEAKFTALRL